ncbi:MAG: sirohydrochlorin cobaltochelatase, partial [Eubacteriaceae bacterium]|nr:sirohydrochlorin cobaltochelatase [Eubacteriaceae bacterium]
YSQMKTQMDKLGYANVFIGTVEGEPEDTACEAVIADVKAAGYKYVVLRPLMVVAGDHANNDMAGDDEDSWKSMFTAAGLEVTCQIAGLGGIPEIQQLYVVHTGEVIK